MLVFHGTTDYFTEPITSKGEKYKDFGVGFYLTALQEQAEEFAEGRKDSAKQSKKRDAIVHVFDLDYEKFTSKDFNYISFDKYDEKWVDFIIENRRNAKREKHHQYGTVYGPIADGDTGLLLSLYERNKISKEKLLKRLSNYSGPIKYQFYFGSQKAIRECLSYCVSYVVSATPINMPDIYNSTLPDNIHIKWKFDKKNRYIISGNYANYNISVSSQPKFEVTHTPTFKDIWPSSRTRT